MSKQGEEMTGNERWTINRRRGGSSKMKIGKKYK